MKVVLFFMLLFLLPFVAVVYAGGLLTNTNQHVAFLRMPARGASIGIDGVYSNPAGLSFMEDGQYISANVQGVYQTRNIETEYDWNFEGQNTSKKFKGKVLSPVIPSIYAVYKKGKCAISAMTAFTGGGGKASFDDGLPMFTAAVETQLYSYGYTSDEYDLSTSLDGSQYIVGLQAGISYELTDWLSAYVGGRMSYILGGYKGHVDVTLKDAYGGTQLYDMQLDCDQRGWGVAPLIATDIKWKRFNYMLKYEFKTDVDLTNHTEKNTDEDGTLAAYKDGVKTPSDVPALFATALGYEIVPDKLRATVEYHFFDDKNADMADHKEKYLTGGTNEYLAGIEWDLSRRFTLSCGGQITDYGLADDFEQQTSFSCDSYSIGAGCAVNLTEKLKLNAGYFVTIYSDYEKEMSEYAGISGMPSGTDTYSRTSNLWGIGVDYKF